MKLYHLKISIEMTIIVLLMIFFMGLVVGLTTRTIEGVGQFHQNKLSLERTLEKMEP